MFSLGKRPSTGKPFEISWPGLRSPTNTLHHKSPFLSQNTTCDHSLPWLWWFCGCGVGQQCSATSPFSYFRSFFWSTVNSHIFYSFPLESWPNEKLLSKTQTCRKTCNKMPSIVQVKLLKNTTLKKTLPPLSKRNLIKNTTQHGTALLAVTLAVTSHMKQNILSTFTWAKLRSCCLNLAKPSSNNKCCSIFAERQNKINFAVLKPLSSKTSEAAKIYRCTFYEF